MSQILNLSNIPSEATIINNGKHERKINISGSYLVLAAGESVKIKVESSSELISYYSQLDGDLELTLSEVEDEGGNTEHTHTLVQVQAVSPTCTTAGNISYYRCNSCGKLYSDASGLNQITQASTIVAAKGHTYGSTQTKAATCTETGKTYRVCTVCGHEEVLSTIPATGHSYGNWTPVDATNHKKVCTACGHSVTEVHTLKYTSSGDTEHTASCSTCGYSKTEAHTFGDWVITKPATTAEAGSKQKTCSICKHVIVEEIPKLDEPQPEQPSFDPTDVTTLPPIALSASNDSGDQAILGNTAVIEVIQGQLEVTPTQTGVYVVRNSSDQVVEQGYQVVPAEISGRGTKAQLLIPEEVKIGTVLIWSILENKWTESTAILENVGTSVVEYPTGSIKCTTYQFSQDDTNGNYYRIPING